MFTRDVWGDFAEYHFTRTTVVVFLLKIARRNRVESSSCFYKQNSPDKLWNKANFIVMAVNLPVLHILLTLISRSKWSTFQTKVLKYKNRSWNLRTSNFLYRHVHTFHTHYIIEIKLQRFKEILSSYISTSY